MKLKSKDLLVLINAMSKLFSVTTNQIAIYSEEAEYAEALDELEADLKDYQKLSHKLEVAYDKALNKENQARITKSILDQG